MSIPNYSNYPPGVTDDDEHFTVENAQSPWLAQLLDENGAQCGNCGAFRVFNNPVLEECDECGDEPFDVFIAEGADIP